MKVVDLATSIWNTEINQDPITSIPAICSYIRYNIGDLNNLLGTSFTLNVDNLEIYDENQNEISPQAMMIYKYLYLLSYYARQIRANLGSGGATITLSYQSDGGAIRTVDKTAVAKVYQQLRKDVEEKMKELVNKYKLGHQFAVDVVGNDIYVSPQTYSYDNQATPGVLFPKNIY